jgi:hypothetical protein
MTRTAHVIPVNHEVVYEQVIHVIECASCNIDFGIGRNFETARREDHATFYCPNGHGNVYKGDSEAEKLRKEVERMKVRERLARDSERFYRDQAAASRRSAAAVRGHLTRLRKRIAAGVCPCCNRSFENVRRHIEGQHPEWAGDHAEALEPAGA